MSRVSACLYKRRLKQKLAQLKFHGMSAFRSLLALGITTASSFSPKTEKYVTTAALRLDRRIAVLQVQRRLHCSRAGTELVSAPPGSVAFFRVGGRELLDRERRGYVLLVFSRA
jgi:hypothetical protein